MISLEELTLTLPLGQSHNVDPYLSLSANRKTSQRGLEEVNPFSPSHLTSLINPLPPSLTFEGRIIFELTLGIKATARGQGSDRSAESVLQCPRGSYGEVNFC